MKITVETNVNTTLDRAWQGWISPDDIIQWNFASQDWCCPKAQIQLEVGKRFNYRMEAKDGSFGFDFEGTFTKIILKKYIEYKLDDARLVSITFEDLTDQVRIIETFDTENINSVDLQKQGWQSILDNFKKHIER